MEYIGPIHIFHIEIAVHLLHEHLNQVKVSVIGREMKSCELFISLLVCPSLQRSLSGFAINFRQIVFNPMLENSAEAMVVVLEGTER